MDSLPMKDISNKQDLIMGEVQIEALPERRILIAEDDLSLQPLWERAIASKGGPVIVDWATSMADAERLIRYRFKRGTPYDLVVSDIFLEGMGSGIDLWNHYGEEAKNFVLVTAVPITEEKLMKRIDFGHPECLRKPLNFQKCSRIADIAFGLKY